MALVQSLQVLPEILYFNKNSYNLWQNNEIDKNRGLVVSYDQLTENLMVELKALLNLLALAPAMCFDQPQKNRQKNKKSIY